MPELHYHLIRHRNTNTDDRFIEMTKDVCAYQNRKCTTYYLYIGRFELILDVISRKTLTTYAG